MYPWAAFGIFNALSGPALTTNSTPKLLDILGRAPHTVLWMWLHILAFTISNQRNPDSITEDSINKAWRPLPSGRITAVQARRLLLAVVPTVIVASIFLGGHEASMLALLLNWMYNDLKGGDEIYVVRNLLNALGLIVGSVGTTVVACGRDHGSLSVAGYYWVAIEGAIIFTTVHLMDLRDQAGDRAHGRRTLPIVLGDTAARWTIVVALMLWSLLCPTLWSLGVWGSLPPLILGALISGRVLSSRTVKADKLSWNLWGLWMASIFLLPLLHDHSVFARAVAGS